jgi:hypothetical protein
MAVKSRDLLILNPTFIKEISSLAPLGRDDKGAGVNPAGATLPNSASFPTPHHPSAPLFPKSSSTPGSSPKNQKNYRVLLFKAVLLTEWIK